MEKHKRKIHIEPVNILAIIIYGGTYIYVGRGFYMPDGFSLTWLILTFIVGTLGGTILFMYALMAIGDVPSGKYHDDDV